AAVVLLGLAVTIVVTVPRVGPWLALAVLVGAALLFLRRMEEAADPGFVLEPDRPATGPMSRAARRLGRLATAASLVVGLVGPLLLADGSTHLVHRPPPLPGPLLLVLIALAWIALPLAAFVLVGRSREGRLGPRRALAVVRRRPWS